MPPVLRIIDANANRAREALRVMEEAARFILNHPQLTADLKQLRHDLQRIISAIEGLEANRDTPGDVGTANTTPTEMTRGSAADVAIAAGKRFSEACRVMEEYGKTLGDHVGGAGFAAAIEKLRYRGYDIEHRLQRALASGRAQQWKLCVLLTESLCTHHDWQSVLRMCLDAGADCVQVREKQMTAGWLLRRTQDVLEIVRGRATVIVNDRPDVALLAGADGVHVGQTDLPVAEVRRLVGRQLLVGVSTSNLEHARRAIERGADYCGLGPMFATTTVDDKPNVVGPAYAKQFIEALTGKPHLAIGGIDLDNVAHVVAAGVRGIAVSNAVCSAENPEAAATALVDAVTSVLR